MKAKFNKEGRVILIPQNETEVFALKQWDEINPQTTGIEIQALKEKQIKEKPIKKPKKRDNWENK